MNTEEDDKDEQFSENSRFTQKAGEVLFDKQNMEYEL